MDAYGKHILNLTKEVKRQQTFSSDIASDMSCARAWLEAYIDNQVFSKLEIILRVVRERASVVAMSSSDIPSRCAVVSVVRGVVRPAECVLGYRRDPHHPGTSCVTP